jgi:predicted acetyltransferase
MLMKPSKEYASEIIDFQQELLNAGSEFAGCGSLYDCASAEEWLERVEKNETTCSKGGVTSNSYIAVRTGDHKIVGIIDLRHHIDHPILSVWGGHMGYTVRPSERGKGYAKDMLRQNLQNCRTRGLDKVLLVCDHDNIASEKTILANGGVFEKEIDVDGSTMKRFWIAL